MAARRVTCVQVDEVKNIMVDNIEKVLERGEKIELLVDKTDNLRFQVFGCSDTIICFRQFLDHGTGKLLSSRLSEHSNRSR